MDEDRASPPARPFTRESSPFKSLFCSRGHNFAPTKSPKSDKRLLLHTLDVRRIATVRGLATSTTRRRRPTRSILHHGPSAPGLRVIRCPVRAQPASGSLLGGLDDESPRVRQSDASAAAVVPYIDKFKHLLSEQAVQVCLLRQRQGRQLWRLTSHEQSQARPSAGWDGVMRHPLCRVPDPCTFHPHCCAGGQGRRQRAVQPALHPAQAAGGPQPVERLGGRLAAAAPAAQRGRGAGRRRGRGRGRQGGPAGRRAGQPGPALLGAPRQRQGERSPLPSLRGKAGMEGVWVGWGADVWLAPQMQGRLEGRSLWDATRVL